MDPGAAANGVPVTCNGGNDCETQVTGQWFYSPFVLNRVNPTRVALAGGHVYVATDTAPANAPSVDLMLTDLGPTGGSVSALAYGTRDNPNVILAGNNNGVAPVNGALYLSTTGTPGSIAQVPGYTTGQIPNFAGIRPALAEPFLRRRQL